jgi:hypothetical protein
MRLSLALGGFQGTVPLERWLIGAEPARSRVNAHTQGCKLGDSSGILIGGSGVGEFSPNWVLRLTGPRVARLFGFGGEMFSDSIAISVLGSDDPSILNKPEPKRTLISLERGKHAWLLSPGLSAGKAGKLVPLDNIFDLINVEVGESQTGAPSRALVAESKGEETRVAARAPTQLGPSGANQKCARSAGARRHQLTINTTPDTK